MGLFIDDIDDRVMRIGMTVSSDQKVIFGNGKSLRSHGSTDGRSIFFSENLCFCSIKSRNNISTIINFSIEYNTILIWYLTYNLLATGICQSKFCTFKIYTWVTLLNNFHCLRVFSICDNKRITLSCVRNFVALITYCCICTIIN